MAVYNRYKKYRKAIKYADGSIVFINPAIYKKGELISQSSFETLEDCMYNYQYRWNKIEVVESDKNTYICEGFSQYYKEVYQKSLDNVHWVDVEPKQERKGDLIKEYSESCGYVPLIEWRLIPIVLGNPNTYICYNGDLYTRENQYISYDNGLSYQPSGLSRKGNLYQSNSELCAYTLNGSIYDADKKEVMTVAIYTDNDFTESDYYYQRISSFNIENWEKENNKKIILLVIGGHPDITPNPDIRFNNVKPTCQIKFAQEFNSIDFNGFNTSEITNMSDMFTITHTLTELDVSNFNTSKVTNVRGMFSSCLSTEKINVSGLDASNVTDMSAMFAGNSKLKTIDFSNFKMKNVTNMQRMFQSCKLLQELDVSNFDTSKVTDMGQMFQECNSLTTLDVSNFNTSQVTDMGWMFLGCNSLTTLDVSNFDTSKVTYMNNMFRECNSLTTLDVSNFDTSKVTDMYCMFYQCNNLTTLDVSNFDTSQVTNVRGMFSNCTKLEYLNISNFDLRKIEDEIVDMFNTEGTLNNLKTLKANNIYINKCQQFFANLDNTKEIDLSGANTEGSIDMSYMFSGCNSLTSLDLSNFDTSKVTNMSYMFSGCNSLTLLDLSNFDTSNIDRIGSLFYNCYNLTTLYLDNFNLPEFNISNIMNFSNIFGECNNLTYIRCTQNFKDWCINNYYNINLPEAMQEGGSGTWEIVG